MSKFFSGFLNWGYSISAESIQELLCCLHIKFQTRKLSIFPQPNIGSMLNFNLQIGLVKTKQKNYSVGR